MNDEREIVTEVTDEDGEFTHYEVATAEEPSFYLRSACFSLTLAYNLGKPVTLSRKEVAALVEVLGEPE